MNTDNTLETAEEYPNNADDAGSVDDFIRELENLEQDLHITSELKIEVSESEFDDRNLPDFIVEDLKAASPKSIEPAKLNISSNETQMRLRSEITSLENTIVKFKTERQEILDRSRRQAEDFENFRNRTDRERHERLSSQMENLARQMLPVIDNLNRALDFGMAMPQEKRDEIGPFFDGIMLVNQQMHDVMTEMGVQPIVAVGQDFDPHLHEAVAIDQNAELPPNTVAEEMLRGYRMGNRVIRHSMVKVTAPTATNSAANNASNSAVDNDLPPQLT
jgi:molecular chaperone GrpE